MPRTFYLLIALLLTITIQTTAQELPQDRVPGLAGRGMANYSFAQRGDLPIFVSVWGAVRLAGRYEIPVGTDLGQLLSLAGGPGADLRGFEGIDIRGSMGRAAEQGKTIVRLSRLQGEQREIILELRIDDLLRLREEQVVLQDGDIIMIDQVRPFRVWDALGAVASVATIILLIDRFIPIFGD